MRSLLTLVALTLLPVLALRGEEADSASTSRFGWFAYPFVFYTPETDLAFGAGAVLSMRFSPRPAARPSTLTFSGYYSINGQFDLTLVPEAYLNHDRLLLSGKFNGGQVIERMYGIGPTAPGLDNDRYDAAYVGVSVKAVASVREHLKAGAVLELKSVSIRDARGNPFLADPALTGVSGGVHVGLGASLEFDSRDNIMYPSHGVYAFMTAVAFTPAVGSDFRFQRYTVDARAFTEPWPGNILALQLYAVLISRTPPFYEYALLGGDRIMRGYITGRYRDHVHTAVQAEYRRRIWWKFGAILFAGAGDVAPNLWAFQIKYIKPTYGFGLRFSFDDAEKMDLRADMGFGRGTSGIYFAINQAF
jgi:outer membrane protein assembly factor BamA